MSRAKAMLIVCLAAACSTSSDETGADKAKGTDKSALRTVTRVFKFEDKPLPSGFTPSSGTWSIVDDATAPSARRVLEQTAASATGDFNLILGPTEDSADIEIGVKVCAVAGEIDQGGGIVWRARDARNYYVARVNPLESNLRVFKVVDGVRQQIESADVSVAPGWHELGCTMRGDSIQCSLDGRVLLRARDTAFAGAGRVGLWTKADAKTRFDDLSFGPGL
jgi:hypothetical protein